MEGASWVHLAYNKNTGGLLWPWWAFGLHYMLGTYRLAEDLFVDNNSAPRSGLVCLWKYNENSSLLSPHKELPERTASDPQ